MKHKPIDPLVLKQALSVSSSPVTITDATKPDNPIIWCNDAFKKLTGYSEKEILGHNCRFLQGPDTNEADVEAIRDGLAASLNTRVLIKNYTKKGHPFWNDLDISPVHDEDGELRFFIGLQNDITTKLSGESAERRASKLEKINAIMRDEQARLEELNNAKDDFVSVASHQLRTPATVVKQYLGMLEDGFAGSLTDKQLKFLEIAQENNERQLHIIDRLLDLARLESGRLTLTKNSFDVGAMVRSAAASLLPIAENMEQTIEVALPKKTILARGDETLLRAVLENLLDNAIRYSYPGGTCRVSVSSRATTARITVRDYGIGMDATTLRKAFMRFTRIENRELKEIGGTGIGLYWAKQIVKLHKGEIRATSKLGEGSEFTILLPLKRTRIKK